MKLFSLFLTILMLLSFSGCTGIRQGPTGASLIRDDKVYILYNNDHEAPTEMEGFMQFEYESVYALPLKRFTEKRKSKGKRLSEIGNTRGPVWSKDGDRIAYLSFIMEDSIRIKTRQIKVREVSSGFTQVLEGLNSCTCGLSWDESGKLLAFGQRDSVISMYDLEKMEKVMLFQSQSRPEGISLSPDGKHIIFMSRDGTHMNDADGWRPNLFTMGEKEVIKIGFTDDKFGVLSQFWWNDESTQVVFRGFYLDENENREYLFARYDLRSRETTPFHGDVSKFYSQRVRYWTADQLY